MLPQSGIGASDVETALRRIRQAAPDAPYVYVTADQDLAKHIEDLTKKDEFKWVRLLAGEWHLSLCMRLTIGSTFGPPFLTAWVQQALGVTQKTAERLASGCRWRRSGELFLASARAIVRHFVRQWRAERGSERRPDEFRVWMVIRDKRSKRPTE